LIFRRLLKKIFQRPGFSKVLNGIARLVRVWVLEKKSFRLPRRKDSWDYFRGGLREPSRVADCRIGRTDLELADEVLCHTLDEQPAY